MGESKAAGNLDEAQLMSAVLESSPSFVHVLRGPALVFEYANEAYRRLVGRDELLGRPAFEVLPEASGGGFPEIIAGVMRTRVPYRGVEMPVTLRRSPSGPEETRYVDVSYVPILSADGTCERVAGHGSDVTDHVEARRKAERGGDDARERLSLALATARMSSWEWNPATGLIGFSEAMPELYGVPADAPTSSVEHWLAALLPEDRERQAALVADAVRRGGAWHAEFRVGSADDPRWLEERAQASVDAQTGERRVIGLVWDVTDRKRLEDELREADRRKDVFLATLAHELRNPLAPLRNGLELIKLTSGLDPKVSAARTMMDRQLTHLVRLVDDLLEVSRITSGKVELRRSRVDLGASILAAMEATRDRFERKRIRVEFDVEDGLDVDGDPDRLAQVFSNLLVNAAKFTPEGGSARIEARAEGNEAVATVSDDGAGISRESLDAIFEMFVQAPGAGSAGGLGIGLALARQLTALHGGSVAARSEGEEKGSEFVVRLPLARGGDVAAVNGNVSAPAADHDRGPRDVLVVDDNVDAAESLAEALRLRGHATRVAHGGDEALDECERRLPDVVVMDIGMPGRDGYDTAREIVRRWGDTRLPRLAALTGWGQAEDRRRASEAGFELHFTKPADLDDLAARLGL